MADVTEKYTLEFETNAAKAASEVKGLSATLDEMGRTGELSGKGLNAASRGVLAIEKALGRSSSAVSKYSKAFSNLRKEVSDAERAIQSLAQKRVAGGKNDPLAYSANRMSLSDAQRNLAVGAAGNLSIESVSRERVRLEERLNEAKKQGAAYDQRLVNLGRDRGEVARENLAIAQKELAAAQKVQTRVSTGAGAGAVPYTPSEQVRAEENLAAAKKKVYEATKQVTAATQTSSEGYVALRYALYDVSRTALVASAAIAGVGVATVKSFADTESGFSALERTSGLYGDALGPLRDELLELSRVLPVATADIQSFAARGAQLGIAQESIDGFTETIAKFVATSPEVDINSVAEAFGRISNLTGTDDFTALASSIALVGVNAAATDQQIIKTTQEFARAAATTSLTADEIIGISAAFASLGVQPEAARGVANQFFTQLNEGAAGLNDSMAVAAQMMGMTEQAAASLFKTDTGTFFQNFVTGLSQTEDVTLALSNMGLEGARLGPAFAALAKNTRDSAAGQSVLSRAMADANQGFRERLELDRQFAPIADDVNSKTLLIANAFRELAYEIGLELAPTLGVVLDGVKNLINGLSEFIQTPVGESVVRMVATLSGLAVVAGGLVSIIAGVAASGLALRFALQQVAGSGFAAAFTGVANAIRGIGVASAGSASLLVALGNAFKYLGRVIVIGALLYAASELIFNFGGAVQWIGGVIVEFVNFLFDAARAVNEFFGGFEVFSTSGGATQELQNFGRELQAWGKSLGDANADVSEFTGGQLAMNDVLEDFGGNIMPDAVDGMDDYGNSAGQAAQEVRTLVDYANDLAKVWDRAFDIRFGGQTTLDAITSSFISIREAADEAAKRIRDLNNDIASLSSDIKIQEYFLSIAIEYGDTKRAAAIEAELAKKRAELADKTDELQSEQDAANKSLEGNSKGAIENRKTITDLVRQYQAHIGALAASGMSQADLAIATQRLKADFIAQATQLGYNRAELERYAAAFDDVATAIARVPRNITVTASVDPAVQAFNELEAATNRANNAYNGLRGNLAAPVQTGGINPAGANRMANLASLQAEIARLTSELGALSGFNQLAHLNRIYAIRDQIRNGQYYTGGFTGRGGMYEPAGTVHRGEYVFPKSAVDQSTGLPTQAALLGMLGSLPSRSVAAPSRAASSSGATQVALTAGSIQAIAQAVQPYLVIDGKLVGDATSRAYANDTMAGAY